MLYDHFHAHLVVYTGKLANTKVYIEGGLAQSIDICEYQNMRNEWTDDDFENWMIELVSNWLPEDMTREDKFTIDHFWLAG